MLSHVSVLLSHTVLLRLHQEELVTKDELERMKPISRGLSYALVSTQCNKPSELATRTADLLELFGHDDEAMQLRGW